MTSKDKERITRLYELKNMNLITTEDVIKLTDAGKIARL